MKKSDYPGGLANWNYREAKANYVRALMVASTKCYPELALGFWHSDTELDAAKEQLRSENFIEMVNNLSHLLITTAHVNRKSQR